MISPIEYSRVTKDDDVLMRHLQSVHEGLYADLFPHAEDRESWRQWTDFLTLGADENFFILAGKNLRDANPSIYGFVTSTYYKKSATGLVGYLGVNPNHRSSGTASGMIERVKTEMQVLTLNALFAEAYDPDKVAADTDSIVPSVRLKIYHRWGAMQCPIDYSVPCVTDMTRKLDNLVLLSLPVDGKYARPTDIIGFVGDYYTASGFDITTDADYARIEKQLADGPDLISLAGYDEKNP